MEKFDAVGFKKNRAIEWSIRTPGVFSLEDTLINVSTVGGRWSVVIMDNYVRGQGYTARLVGNFSGAREAFEAASIQARVLEIENEYDD